LGNGLAPTLLNYGLFLYNFILAAVVFMALALTLNGYDIKQNRRRVLFTGIALGIASLVFLHLPPTFRIILQWAFIFCIIKLIFGFTTKMSVLVTLSILTVAFTAESITAFVLFFIIGVMPADYLALFTIRLVCPLAYFTPLAVLTHISYRRRWQILKETARINIPVGTFLPLLIQILLIFIVVNELFFAMNFEPSTRKITAIIFALLTISLFLSLFLLWRFLHFAQREAVVAAQKKLAEEMNRETDVLRCQNHDFINHIQIIIALLSEGRKEELATYVKATHQQCASCQPPTGVGIAAD